MSTLKVMARNTSPDSQNPIHTDAALGHGFSGAIVPGLTLFAYAFAEPRERWGDDWLGRGEASMRFKRPVYDGDSLLITCTERSDTEEPATEQSATGRPATGRADAGIADGGVYDVEVHVEGRGLCADGSFRRRTDTARPLPVSFPVGQTPGEPPPVDEASLRNAGPLPVLPIDTSSAYVASWLDAHEITDPIYRDVVHPAMLSRVSAHVLPLRFQFEGPRVHRGLRASFFAARPVGTPTPRMGQSESGRSGMQFGQPGRLGECPEAITQFGERLTGPQPQTGVQRVAGIGLSAGDAQRACLANRRLELAGIEFLVIDSQLVARSTAMKTFPTNAGSELGDVGLGGALGVVRHRDSIPEHIDDSPEWQRCAAIRYQRSE